MDFLADRSTPSPNSLRARPSWVVCHASRVFALLERVSKHKALICLLFIALAMGARITLLRRFPIPQPYVSDEFGYLLGAETFASGRLTNPVHPMWVHFETPNELMRPTYMSKYPPGQSLFLAMGCKLFGHPWFGVLISYGLFAGCLCWMLQDWVPPIYATLGTAITLVRISILGYWMNSYWGGAVAAGAGCLLLGTLPRLARRVNPKDIVLASTGLVLLANTRPYEGLVMSAAAVVALLFWRARRRSLRELFSAPCVVPLVLVCGAGAMATGYYNYRITGSALQTPWSAYFRQYHIASPWIMFPESKPPFYRHADIKNTWVNQNLEAQEKMANPLLNLRDLHVVFAFYCSALYLFPVAIGILLSGGYRVWTAATICFCVWCGLLFESFKAPHYIAGSVGLLPLLAMYGFRWLRAIGRSYGPVLVLTLTALLLLQGQASEWGQSWQTRRNVLSHRMIAMGEAMKQGGRHLILVRYSADHIDRGDECVYNGADIDAGQIVWARDMGQTKNRELIDYYGGSRRSWLYQPDTDPAKLIPYESANQ